jgi:small subunit ribosomal protein S28e
MHVALDLATESGVWHVFGGVLQVTQVRVKFLDDQNRLIMRNVKGPVREGEQLLVRHYNSRVLLYNRYITADWGGGAELPAAYQAGQNRAAACSIAATTSSFLTAC